MIIEKINIKSFGLITDMTLELADDINVFVGRNESGKSTIAAFIRYMLYGFSNDTPEGVVDERTKRINWKTGLASGVMTVRAGNKRYTISRETKKVENGGKTAYEESYSIIDNDTGSPVFGKMPAGEAFFGVDASLFENTAFIGQISDTAINENSVKESMENILFSMNEKVNCQRAAAKVAVSSENLLHKNGQGGFIYELKRRSEQLEEKLHAANDASKRVLMLESKLHEVRAERKKQMGIKAQFEDLDDCHNKMIIIQQFDELHSLDTQLDEKEAEHHNFVCENKIGEFVPTEEYYNGFIDSRKRVDDAYRAHLDAQEHYEKEKHEVGITKEMENAIEHSDTLGGENAVLIKAKKHKKNSILYTALGIGGVLLAIAALVYELVATGVMAGLVPRIIFGALGGLAFVGAGVLVFLILNERRELLKICEAFKTSTMDDLCAKLAVIAEDRAKRDKLIADIESARVAVENAKTDYEKAKNDLLENILVWGVEPPTSNLNAFLNDLEKRAREYLDREAEIIAEKEALNARAEELRAILADKSEVEIKAQILPLKRKVLSEIHHETILEGIEKCKQTIAALDEEEKAVEDELFVLKTESMDPVELFAKKKENDERVEELESLHKASLLALDAIEKASDRLRMEISPRLGAFTAELLGIMTDEKYTSVDVSDGLKLTFVGEDGEKRSVDCLSGGTRDLTYISLRMALVDMLYDEKPPVCFDESFAHQDNARANSMMVAIKALAGLGQQSFIFTCREREPALAREVSETAAIFKLSTDEDAIA